MKKTDLSLTLVNFIILISPKQNLNLGPSRIADFEDCNDTALTTQPSGLNEYL